MKEYELDIGTPKNGYPVKQLWPVVKSAMQRYLFLEGQSPFSITYGTITTSKNLENHILTGLADIARSKGFIDFEITEKEKYVDQF